MCPKRSTMILETKSNLSKTTSSVEKLFFFFQMGRNLAFFTISDCHFVVLLDLIQTGKSFLRQGKEDATKA